MRRVLVLGATGHIGQAVVRHSLARGLQVTATTRQADPPALRGLDVRTARVDEELSTLPEIAAGHDLLIDAAAPHPLDPCPRGGVRWRRIVAAALARTERVLETARNLSLPLVFISSFTTLARRESPVYPYFETKAAMENRVLEAAREMPIVVVNPAACLGPWEFRGEGSSFVRLALAGRLPAVIGQALNVIDVRDVAAAIHLALAHECFGRPIPLAGHNTTVPALVARIAALGGRPAATLPIDPRAASAAAFWTQAAFAALGRPAPDLWRAVPLIAAGFPMSPSLEQSTLGLAIRPLEETLRDAVLFHSSRGPI